MARLFAAVALAAVSSAAVAAPVPKPPPPLNPKAPATFTMGVAKVNGQNFELITTDKQFETVLVKESKDGKAVETPALRLKQVPITRTMPLTSVKAVIDGKEYIGEELAKKLANPTAVVYWDWGYSPAWFPLFGKDVAHMCGYQPPPPKPETPADKK